MALDYSGGRKQSGGVRLGVGGSSIVVIFVILTLTIFATLSLVSAKADQSLSSKSAAATAAFYAADSEAEELLYKLDSLLISEAPYKSPDFYEKTELLLADGGFEAIIKDDGLFVGYTVQINNIQWLEVEISVHDDPVNRYTIKQWKLVTDPGEEIEDPLILWDGGI